MPEITTEELFEAFGLEKPAEKPDGGRQGEEPKTDPETEPETPEEREPEGGQPEEQPKDDGSGAEKAGEEKKPGQTEEERRQNAARRRAAEQKAAVDDAVQKALKAEREENDRRMKAFFEKARLRNTITKEPITSMEEFDRWSESFEAEQLSKDLKAGRLTPEALQYAVEQSPIMQRAKAIVDESERKRKETEERADRERIDAEIAEIGKLDPSVTSVADLLTAPWAEQFKAYVDKGNTFVDAYYLATREEREKTLTEKAREQAASNARSKDHLKPVGSSRGQGAAPVPADVMEYYRALNPNATEAEIQAHWQKSHKK